MFSSNLLATLRLAFDFHINTKLYIAFQSFPQSRVVLTPVIITLVIFTLVLSTAVRLTLVVLSLVGFTVVKSVPDCGVRVTVLEGAAQFRERDVGLRDFEAGEEVSDVGGGFRYNSLCSAHFAAHG